MSILVVGSVAFDTIKSLSGSVEKELGGAATYFGLSASYFTDVRVVAVVGEDFGPEQEAVFKKRNIDMRGHAALGGQDVSLGGRVRREPERSEDKLHAPERVREASSRRFRQTTGDGLPIPGEYRSDVAGHCAAPDEWRETGRRRHDELLDQRHIATNCWRH